MITFRQFEEAYVKTHGACTTKDELNKFFNLAESMGLKKPEGLSLNEAINSGRMFKHKNQQWFYDPNDLPRHLSQAVEHNWELLQPEDEERYKEKVAIMKATT